ncbi:hypothetical protein RclHR1_03390010 [Rhizophagus clarus]|uniref:Uncharacterized protein n=1 Tax=Rhizophagus clarus TaxID=94130 RepID=A0A2Z6RLD5_9GLOM|nr:hypothetical protein RclHR1_03390010 [Rhizophagus clarus]GES85161.1 hypothetical protein GLOIN_2v1786427 [Rhizophagus clarus]
MVFTENKPSTEPFSFVLLKKLCSFSFCILLIYYSYNQFSQFFDSITEPNLNIRNFINNRQSINRDIKVILLACSPYSLNCTYNDRECEEYDDRTDICDGNTFRYVFNYRDKAEIKITPVITEAYLAGVVIDDKYYLTDGLLFTKPNSSLFLMNEQINIIYYSFKINKRMIDNYIYGLAGGDGLEFVNFDVQTDHINHLTTPNETTLKLIPASTDIYYQEETYYDLGSIISGIGGFFSSLSGIYVFLFGETKLAPWGFMQTHVFNCLCTGYKRKFIKKLKNKYEPIPFVSGRAKNVTLEERVQNIENILKEYYLDTDFLNSLLVKYNKVNDNKYDDIV